LELALRGQASDWMTHGGQDVGRQQVSLNLIMRKMFIEMGLDLSDLTLVHEHSMVSSHDSRPLSTDAST
jgi:hypothetical protein